MPTTRGQARLIINDTDVGRVSLRTLADSWGFGEFEPNAAFSAFAAIFGNWSLLMHADDDQQRLSPAASEELRRAEAALDALRCKLLFEQPGELLELSQLNIDGNLVEWKVSRRHKLRSAG